MTLPVGIRSPCIFCRREAAGARSSAHIISHSLIEDAPALPPGSECDACNNKLSRVEQVFINDYLGSFYRVLHLTQTKKGKVPSATWKTATVRAVDGPDGRRRIEIRIQGRPPATMPHSFRIELPIEKPVVVSRFICKVGIEALHYFNLPVFDPRLDSARTFAIDPQSAPFIPYAFRCPQAGELPGFGLVDSPELMRTAGLSVPAIMATIPGLVFRSPLLPAPEATVALTFLRSEGWSVRDSVRRPKRQVMMLTLRRARRPRRRATKRS